MSTPATSCAVVGAGLTGMVAAWRLARAGWQVTVFERWPAPGGLVALFEAGGEKLECFYHHIFTTDTDYVALADELGLGGEIEWLPSRMGIYSQGRLWDFGTPASLLAFRPMSWPDKVRFALSTLYMRHRSDLAEFEKVTAREWLLAHAGRTAFDSVWGPLLQQKFAERADVVSMAWLWQKIYLRGRSRSASGMGERLGYMRGSFGKLVDVLTGRLRDAGVILELATPVKRLRPADGAVEVETRRGTARFDRVLFTAAPQELDRVAGEHLPDGYRATLQGIEHANALCAVLELDRSLSPYYWLNVADPGSPFGGVIEHTNYIPKENYGGRHVLYISDYVLPDDPKWTMRNEQLWGLYLPALARINPRFEADWILKKTIERAEYAQPIIPAGYSRLLPPLETPVPGLYSACMAQIYPEDRGQNYAVRIGREAAELLTRRHG